MKILETGKSAPNLFYIVAHRIHFAVMVKSFLANHGVVIIQPPHTPHLAAADISKT